MFFTRFAYDNSSLSVIAYIKNENQSLFRERIIAMIKTKKKSSSSSSSYLLTRHFEACPLHLHRPPTAKSAREYEFISIFGERRTILMSVAVTQSCKTGLESNSYADGRPSSVLNARRDSLIDDN